MGAVLFELDRESEALDVLKEREHENRNLTAQSLNQYYLGLIFLKNGTPKKAILHLKKSMALATEDWLKEKVSLRLEELSGSP